MITIVKCNFIKVETSAKAWDAYADWVCKNSEEDCSVIMDGLRSLAKEAKSSAELVLTTASDGSELGRIPRLGAMTFGKKIKFTANSSSYKVKIECKEGAGLYHFVFEYK